MAHHSIVRRAREARTAMSRGKCVVAFHALAEGFEDLAYGQGWRGGKGERGAKLSDRRAGRALDAVEREFIKKCLR